MIKVLKVDTVNLNGQGYKVGIQRDDLIVSYNGNRLETTEMLIKYATESTLDSNEIDLFRSGVHQKIIAGKGALGIQVVPVEIESSLWTLALRANLAREQALAARERVIASNGSLMEYEYKVIDIADGSISSLLLGDGRIETNVLEAYINLMALEGWRMVFMTKVMQRHVVVTDRETLMITFERRVLENERAARSMRCVDDVKLAEQGAKNVGRTAAAGAAALVVGGAVIGSMLK